MARPRMIELTYWPTTHSTHCTRHYGTIIGGCTMAMFITIGYGDQAGYDLTAPEVRDDAHAQEAHQRARVRSWESPAVRSRCAITMPPSLPVVQCQML